MLFRQTSSLLLVCRTGIATCTLPGTLCVVGIWAQCNLDSVWCPPEAVSSPKGLSFQEAFIVTCLNKTTFCKGPHNAHWSTEMAPAMSLLSWQTGSEVWWGFLLTCSFIWAHWLTPGFKLWISEILGVNWVLSPDSCIPQLGILTVFSSLDSPLLSTLQAFPDGLQAH